VAAAPSRCEDFRFREHKATFYAEKGYYASVANPSPPAIPGNVPSIDAPAGVRVPSAPHLRVVLDAAAEESGR
jgi:hypothetical protein